MVSKLMVRINASKSSKSWKSKSNAWPTTHTWSSDATSWAPKWKDRSLMPNADAHGTPNLRTNTDKQRSFPLTSPRRWPCEGVPTQSRRLAVDDVSLLMGVPDWLAITLSTDELHPLVAMPTTEPIQVRQMRCQDHPSNPPNIIVYKALFTFYII